MAAPHLPEQYDAEVYTGSLASIPATYVSLHDGTKMLSLTELAADLAIMFKAWINFTQDITSVDAASSIAKGIDLLPCRMQLIKSTTHHLPTDAALLLNPHAAHEVEYDDIEFGDSKVDVSAYTSVKLHNVTPASGNVLLKSDPMGSDNITHVPLKGKMYVFSGPTPKVWDKHRSDLQHLFRPEFFKAGRYLLPNSKLHSTQTEEFRTPPRGRFIWSNCVDEHKITMAPGGMQELKLNYRVKTSIKDFWYKYRDDDLSSSRLGKSICVCLEPSMRRMHINTPIPVVLVKEQHVPIGGSSQNYGAALRRIPVEYQPYEWVRDAVTNVTSKQIRQVVTLGAVQTPTAVTVNADGTGGNLSPLQYAHPGIVGTIPWYKKTEAGVVVATKTPQSGVTSALKWDEISTSMIVAYPELQSFVSRGDPMMFNVQINRNYTATCSLRNSVRLGADKTGVKRKYHEKMVSNMGDVNDDGLVNAADLVEAMARGDIFGDHELETATGAGVRQLVLEGDPQNTALPVAPVTLSISTDAALGTAVGNAVVAAMDSDSSKAGVQMDISQLDSVLQSDLIGGGQHLKFESLGMSTGLTSLSTALAGPGGIVSAVNTAATNMATAATQAATTAATAATDAATIAANAVDAAAVLAADSVTIAATTAASGVTSAATIASAAVVTAAALAASVAIVNGPPIAQVTVTSSAPSANSIANAIAAKSLKVINATGTTLTAGISGSVNVINAPNTLLGVTESAPLTSIDVGNHPTSIDVGNHPTSIDVDNHPASMVMAQQTDAQGDVIPFSVTETAPLTTITTTGHPTQVTIAHSVDAQGNPIPLHVTETAPVTYGGPTADQIGREVAGGDTGTIFFASNNTTHPYSWMIMLSDGTATSYDQAVEANGNWLGWAARDDYQGRTVVRRASGSAIVPNNWVVVQTTPLGASVTGVITEFPNYVGSNVYNGWTIRRDDGALLTGQFFTKVNNSSATGQDFLLHNGKAVQFQGGSNWQEIRMA